MKRKTKKYQSLASNVSGSSSKQNPCLLTADSPFSIREAYNKLRTNIMFSIPRKSGRDCLVFALTSPNPSEGKSTTATNIAISFAMLGKRTLLIDCDLRKPNQHRIWGVRAKTGISDFLAQIDNCPIYEVDSLPLNIIMAGNMPPNPSELLSSQLLSNAVNYFAEKFDCIIIDTPPINTVADAQIISTIVDGIAMVVHAGTTTDHDAFNARTAIEQAGGNFFGYILNGVDMKSSRYSYKYSKYGYSRNGYGYSYGNTPKSEVKK